MSESWVPIPAAAWPDIADAMTKPWPRWAVRFDLRWWADRERMGRGSRPGRPTLCKRWGWGDRAARTVMAAVNEWADPRHGDPNPDKGKVREIPQGPAGVQTRSSEGPAGVQDSDDKCAESLGAGSNEGPAGVQPGSSKGPHARYTQAQAQDTGTEEHPPNPPQAGGEICELTKAGIEPAWRKRLKAAGHETVAAVQALTLDDLKRIPGVGRKTAQGIADAMKANGTPISESQPEQPDPEQQKRNRDERATSDAFGAAWFEVHGTKYQWSLKPNSPERAKRKAVCDLFGVDADDEATRQRLQRVAAAYLADHAAGRAWPENGTATLTTFAAKASEYINADAIRQRRAAARKAEQAPASTLVPTSSPIHAAAWASGNRSACRDAYKAGGWDGVRDFLGQRVTHPDNVIEQLRRQGAVKEAM